MACGVIEGEEEDGVVRRDDQGPVFVPWSIMVIMHVIIRLITREHTDSS